MKRYDAVVIGAGPGGYVAAIRLGQLGKKVLVVEKQYVGGVCLNVGCIPTKALLHAAHLQREAREAARMGLSVQTGPVDLEKLNAWKQGIVDRLVRGIQTLWKSVGVEWIQGTGKLVKPDQVEITLPDGQKELVQAGAVIVATGSRPAELPGFAVDGERVWHSDHAVAFPRIPKKLLVLGAGAIGLEFAFVYRHFGAEVEVFELMDQILPGMDSESARELAKALKRQKITIHTSARAERLEKTASGVRLHVRMGDEVRTVEGEVLLVAVGRRPNTAGIGLEAVGVQMDVRGFVKVNEHMETSVKGVYAIGDIVPGPMLAHKASREGIVAAEHIAGLPSAMDVRAIPSVVYTEPQLASVGLSEEEAKARGIAYRVGKFPWVANGRALTYGVREGFAKIITDENDVVIGVHVVGPEASSLIGEGVLAVEMAATAEDIGLSVHPHPTLSEALMEAAENVHKRAIHIVNR